MISSERLQYIASRSILGLSGSFGGTGFAGVVGHNFPHGTGFGGGYCRESRL